MVANFATNTFAVSSSYRFNSRCLLCLGKVLLFLWNGVIQKMWPSFPANMAFGLLEVVVQIRFTTGCFLPFESGCRMDAMQKVHRDLFQHSRPDSSRLSNIRQIENSPCCTSDILFNWRRNHRKWKYNSSVQKVRVCEHDGSRLIRKFSKSSSDLVCPLTTAHYAQAVWKAAQNPF